MLGFINNFFKNRPDKELKVSPQVPERPKSDQFSIGYDPNLIDELEGTHVHLVNLFGRIWSEFEQTNYGKVATLINQFKADFQAHLLTENVKFYVYLEQALADDKHNLKIVKEFRTDMNEIANAAIKFCRTYQGKFTPEMVQNFKSDYTNIGEIVTRRVSLEEKSLYILYRPR
ncbi:hemerythrin domain-containing protein [Aliikangiella maris]|uniref:Hemerythrin domain-containing protein n=2 Tax=Aliikangiella maris TaxID=3162458 RepID=A0ABV3MJH0_9GAMM